MGEMISMIAHQWRQPLSAIGNSVLGIQSKLSIGKFALDKKEDRIKFLEFLDKKHTNITEYVHSLSETIDDFRNFFKPDKQKEKISLSSPINRALKIVETSMSSKNIDIDLDLQVEDELLIYQNEVMQVILNILKNSEDNFMEKNIDNPKIKISTSKENDSYIIEILDNGGGIPEDILPRIFDPYFSTKNEKNGTGLGLYMSKIIIEEHNNGELSAFNIDDGVCFRMELN
jgi:signal transduction histidine kinase